jgi:ribulose-5-phosphate 4-epimerase/fuculose-1-phosphate aldolase
MANHGLIAVGPDIDRAFINAFIVEEGAKIAYFAQHIGEIKMIPETERKFLYRAFEKLYKDN